MYCDSFKDQSFPQKPPSFDAFDSFEYMVAQMESFEEYWLLKAEGLEPRLEAVRFIFLEAVLHVEETDEGTTWHGKGPFGAPTPLTFHGEGSNFRTMRQGKFRAMIDKVRSYLPA